MSKRISDILASGRPGVSFEVFPPKRDAPFGAVESAVDALCALKPSFMSVTYGAAGGANTNTCAIARRIASNGVTALAHLTCLTSSRERIAEEIAAFRAAGVENVLCLRGDAPADGGAVAAKDFAHAVDLVRALKGAGFCLGGACYPECHPECEHLADDIAHLKEKVEAGLDFVTTQMFFDNNVYFRYLSKLRDAGVVVPVVAGIMPVTNGRQIKRICSLSGTQLPPRFRMIVDRFGNDPVQMASAGVAYATEQIVDLFANGVSAVHVYTMNRPEIGAAILRNLEGIVEAR